MFGGVTTETTPDLAETPAMATLVNVARKGRAMTRRRWLAVAWCVLLVFVGQQVGLTLQGHPGAAILSLAVGVAGGGLAWRWKH